MFPTAAPAPTKPRPNRVAPRAFAQPVVRETPLPHAAAGPAW
jgi:hypothetical protein